MAPSPAPDAARVSPGPARGAGRTAASLRSERLRSHRLSAPARTVADAARHMLATQAQEFWGGRLALAARTKGAPTMRDVDAAFDRGEIVRSWTMRGTIHAIPSEDLGWVVGITGERQTRQAAAVHRREGIDDDAIARAERATRAALAGGGRLTRKELFAVLDGAGVPTAGQRGYHVLTRLSNRGLVCQGPVVPRDGAPTREQYIVLTEEWVRDATTPADPLAEFFVRFVASHGPAGVRDFAWWSGLPLGISRAAAEQASDRLVVVESDPEPSYVVAGSRPRRSAAAREVVALPPFEEYYISYDDRTVSCSPEFLAAVGPGANGMVRPIILARGEIIGVWTNSLAVGRHEDDPLPELFAPGAATAAEVAHALARYRSFVTG